MSTLGEFEIGRVLGTGGSGTVYAARSPAFATEIALKVLREDAALTESERARFMDEAARMRRVSHPALVSVLDAGFLPDGRPYVAMPLLAGESLAVRVARGRMPLHEALLVWGDLLGALTAIHAAGLVHRDIKPENVMVTERDGRLAGTLLDLGIARDVGAPASTTTQLGNVRGTPAYMALERFFGTPASVASDVYEVTVTLYVMLTGGLPWQKAEDATERITPRPPTDAGVELPDALTRAIMRGMAAKPADRFTSADELSRAILSAAPTRRSAARRAASRSPSTFVPACRASIFRSFSTSVPSSGSTIHQTTAQPAARVSTQARTRSKPEPQRRSRTAYGAGQRPQRPSPEGRSSEKEMSDART